MSVALFHDLETRIRELHPAAAAVQEAPTAAPPAPREADVDEAIADARARAAVVAWFNPKALLDISSRALREQRLSRLVPECDQRLSRYGYEWCLRREPRRAALSALVNHRDELRQLLRATEALATDADSRLLRRVLRGQRVKAEALDGDDRGALLRVAEWTDGIVRQAPKPAEVQGLLARDAIKQSLNVLVKKFHGRARELEALRRFIIESRPESDDGVKRAPMLAVSGIGGVGKSALLSQFTKRLLARPAARRPTIVLIDFDRPRFSSGDPVALTFELTRQIAAWFPKLAGELRELRHSARTNLLSSAFANAEAATSGLESVGRSSSELLYRLPRILKKARVGTRRVQPLVIILDTFEVLQGSQAEGTSDDVGVRGVHAVVEWVNDLFFISELTQLKVVVAGRAPISEDPVFGPSLTEEEIRLTGVDRTAAAEMLHDRGLTRRDARLLIDALADPSDGSCNPLILRLAARLVKSGSVRPEALKRGIKGRRTLDQELVQGMLYKRILAHIGTRNRDKTLSALAHPGLVLRRVTPDIISRVLLPIIVPKERRTADPIALFERLKREVWLVRETGPQTVEHRPDLRHMMLRLINASEKSQANRIHHAAIKYYRAGGEPGLNADLADGEAYYHSLMVTTRAGAAKLNAVDVKRRESMLLPSLNDLPAHVLAVVKSILDRELTDKEGLELPEPQRIPFILRQGERCVRNDEPYRALALLKGTNLHPFWELQALASTVAWQEAKQRGLLALPTKPSRAYVVSGDLDDHANLAAWLWFCLGDSNAAYALAASLHTDPRTDWDTIDARLLEQLARRVSYRAVAARDAGRPEMPVRRIPWERLSAEHLGSTTMAMEATRHAVLGLGDPTSQYRVVFSGESLPPSRKLLQTLASSGLPPEMKRKVNLLLRHLRKAGRGASSGEILGDIARKFPQAVIVDPRRWTGLKDQWRLVCPSTEFRGPVKYALLDTFKTGPELAMMAELAWMSLDDLRPRDLEPKTFVRTAMRHSSPGPEIAKLVLFLDRSAALGAFLQFLHQERPKAIKLGMVSGAFARWHRAFTPIENTQAVPANIT
jgi:hypothetical protein